MKPNSLDIFRELLQETAAGRAPDVDLTEVQELLAAALDQVPPVGVQSVQDMIELALDCPRLDPPGEILLDQVISAWICADASAWEALLGIASDPSRSVPIRTRAWNAVSRWSDKDWQHSAQKVQAVLMLTQPIGSSSLLVGVIKTARSVPTASFGPAARAAILKLRAHADARVRRAVCWLVCLATDVEHVRPMLQDASENVQLEAAQVVSRQGHFLKMLEEEGGRKKTRKLASRIRVKREMLGEAVLVLENLTRSSSAEVRQGAVRVLASGFGQDPGIPERIGELAARDPDISVRVAAAGQLAALQKKAASLAAGGWRQQASGHPGP